MVSSPRYSALGSNLPVYPGWPSFCLPETSKSVYFRQLRIGQLPGSASGQIRKIGCDGGNQASGSFGTPPDVREASKASKLSLIRGGGGGA